MIQTHSHCFNRLKDDENLFASFHDKKLRRWHEINAFYCVCEQAFNSSIKASRVSGALCSPSQYLNCTLTNPAHTSKKCNIVTRKKRSARYDVNTAKSNEKHIREAMRIMNLINKQEANIHSIYVREYLFNIAK